MWYLIHHGSKVSSERMLHEAYHCSRLAAVSLLFPFPFLTSPPPPFLLSPPPPPPSHLHILYLHMQNIFSHNFFTLDYTNLVRFNFNIFKVKT